MSNVIDLFTKQMIEIQTIASQSKPIKVKTKPVTLFGFQFKKKTSLWKSNNNIFDPTLIAAFSYNWWQYVGMFNGKVVFNNYNYSPSTRKHQWNTQYLMKHLGIKIDLEVELPRGLNNISEETLKTLTKQIDSCMLDITKGRTKSQAHSERKAKLDNLMASLKFVKQQLRKVA